MSAVEWLNGCLVDWSMCVEDSASDGSMYIIPYLSIHITVYSSEQLEENQNPSVPFLLMKLQASPYTGLSSAHLLCIIVYMFCSTETLPSYSNISQIIFYKFKFLLHSLILKCILECIGIHF